MDFNFELNYRTPNPKYPALVNMYLVHAAVYVSEERERKERGERRKERGERNAQNSKADALYCAEAREALTYVISTSGASLI